MLKEWSVTLLFSLWHDDLLLSRLVYPLKKINFLKQVGHVAWWRQVAHQGTKCSLLFDVCCVAKSFAHAKDLISFRIANVISNDVQYCLFQQEYSHSKCYNNIIWRIIITSPPHFKVAHVHRWLVVLHNQFHVCYSLFSFVIVFSFEPAFVAAPSQPSSIVTSGERVREDKTNKA